MNTFKELVKSRRSIRSYLGRRIDPEKLELCAEAALYSPSACNSQPWKFIIVNDNSAKEKMRSSVFSGLYNMNSFASNAAAYIVLISKKTKLPASIAGYLMRTDFRQIDLGIACSNIVLQAEDLGIGSCILGWFDQRAARRILNIPRLVNIDLIIALGYTDQGPSSERRLKDRDETVSYDRY
ncbi:MAG: nitroreductase family protein [Candidatus Aadella gelida]|nr:nitroreductase family protein [Candidatus Aadella gelida]